MVAGQNIGGTAITADLLAKINAYQVDTTAGNVRWNPPLDSLEKGRITAQTDADGVKIVIEVHKARRKFVAGFRAQGGNAASLSLDDIRDN